MNIKNKDKKKTICSLSEPKNLLLAILLLAGFNSILILVQPVVSRNADRNLSVLGIFHPEKNTWKTGELNDGRAFYRTNISTEETPVIASAKHGSQGFYDKNSNKTYLAYPGGTSKYGGWLEPYSWEQNSSSAFNIPSNSPYRSYNETVFPDNKLKQTFLSSDGTKLFWRKCDWIENSWQNCGSWNTSWLSNLIEGQSQFKSWSEVVFPDNILKQVLLSNDGKTLFYIKCKWENNKYTCPSWDTAITSNLLTGENYIEGVASVNSWSEFRSYDHRKERIKQMVVPGNKSAIYYRYIDWDGEKYDFNTHTDWKKINGGDVSTFTNYSQINSWSESTYPDNQKVDYLLSSDGNNMSSRSYDWMSYTRSDPHIVAYNHNTKSWEGPVLLINTEEELNLPGDDHHYPQVIVDNQGYVHVFHTLHNRGNVIYARSKSPGNIGSSKDDWEVQRIPGTCHNTYGAPFVDNQGELYLFFRSSEQGDLKLGQYYEPEAFIKSSDGGRTWSDRKFVIDPGRPSTCTQCANTQNNCGIPQDKPDYSCCPTDIVKPVDEFGGSYSTIYVNDMIQDKNKNGVHLTFHPTYGRGATNIVSDKGHYAFFDFENDRMYSSSGKDLGVTIESHEYENEGCCQWNTENLNSRLVIEDIENSIPAIYYTKQFKNDSRNPENGNYGELWKAIWNPEQNKWDEIDISGNFGNVLTIEEVDNLPDEGVVVYAKTREYSFEPFTDCDYNRSPIVAFSESNNWEGIELFSSSESNENYQNQDHRKWEVIGISRIVSVPDPHPSIKNFMVLTKHNCQTQMSHRDDYLFTDCWALGAHYVVGEQDLDFTVTDGSNDDKDIDLTTHTLYFKKSWSWDTFTIPLKTEYEYTAQKVLDEVNSQIKEQYGYCEKIDQWKNEDWASHADGESSTDFSIEPGVGYFINCNIDTYWRLKGEEFGQELRIQLEPGWNFIGIPHDNNEYRASELLNDIESQGGVNCRYINRWIGKWDSYSIENNFEIKPDKAHFIYCEGSSSFSPY